MQPVVVRLKIMLIRPANGLNLGGIDSHVFRCHDNETTVMMTTTKTDNQRDNDEPRPFFLVHAK